MRKLLLILLFIPLITAGSFGTGIIDECIDLEIGCGNCTYVNISKIIYPNNTDAVTNVATTQSVDGVTYNYTFCNTTSYGEYHVYSFGDDDGYITLSEDEYDYFIITGSGFTFEQPKAIFYIAMIVLFGCIFILTLYLTTKLPSGNVTDGFDNIISINWLKYLRPVLFAIAWGLLLAIIFISSNLSLAYLGEDLVGDFLFTIYQVMFWMTIVFMPIWVMYIFISVFRDKETKKMIERGIDVPSKP